MFCFHLCFHLDWQGNNEKVLEPTPTPGQSRSRLNFTDSDSVSGQNYRLRPTPTPQPWSNDMFATLLQKKNEEQLSLLPPLFRCPSLGRVCRVVTCGAIESSCSRSVSSSSNHIWKECAGPGLGYWRCGISYGWNLTTRGSRNRNLAPPFASVRDAAGTLPGPRRAANRMEVTWINYVTSYNPG